MKLKVLLLEDTPEHQAVVARCAEQHQVELQTVETEADFETALANALSDPMDVPDMFLLDLGIDGETDKGLQILRKLRSLTKIRHLPIVIFSQANLDDIIYESYCSGANSYIHKSIAEKKFEERVSRLFEVWSKDTKIVDAKVAIEINEARSGD